MSVKQGILAVLTLGPAYGLQLRDELVSRAPHRASINVGQVYGTLDRFQKSGHIASGGVTDDNLPLYRLTESGKAEANRWLTEAEPVDEQSWFEMLDQVLIAASLQDVDWSSLIDQFVDRWRSIRIDEDTDTDVHTRASLAARRMLADAAIEWLNETRQLFRLDSPVQGLNTLRPRRGRRPGARQAL